LIFQFQIMEAVQAQLEKSLEELRRLKHRANFSPRKFLEQYGKDFLELAKTFPEEDPHIIQDTDPYEPGQPVKWTATMEEWEDFGSLFEKIRSNDVHGVGVALVTLSNDIPNVGLTPGIHKVSLNGHRWSIQRHSNNEKYLSVDILEEGARKRKVDGEQMYRLEERLKASDPSLAPHPIDMVVEEFEQKNLHKPRNTGVYSAMKDVAIREHRKAYFLLPESPIFPLKGNYLEFTRKAAVGIHTPWMYMSQDFGTPFALHNEDLDLVSLNVLHWGAPKVWTTIAPHHYNKIQGIISKELAVVSGKCDQWVRHQAIYIPKIVLDEHKVHYCQFQQSVRQVVITFPLTYHQGFNSGFNVAEAVNFAPSDWTVEGKKGCSRKTCGFAQDISHYMLLDNEDTQQPPEYIDPNDAEAALCEKEAAKTVEDRASKRQKTQHTASSSVNLTAKQSKGQPITVSKPTNAGQPGRPPSKPEPKRVALHLGNQEPSQQSSQYQMPLRSSSGDVSASQKVTTDQSERLITETEISRWTTWEKAQRKLTKEPKLRPTLIYGRLMDVCVGKGEKMRRLYRHEIQNIVKVITAFGSTDAFIQLREILAMIRSNAALVPKNVALPNAKSAAAQLIMLDTIGSSNAWNALLQRYYLAKFSRKTEEEIATAMSASKTYMGLSQAATSVYKTIMSSAYPGLKDNKDPSSEYIRRVRALKRAIYYGKFWNAFVLEFGWGVLALFPTEGEYEVNNNHIHGMTEEVFQIAKKTLIEQKGAWLKGASQALSILVTNNLETAQSIPKYLLEVKEAQEIVQYADQSKELASLAVPVEE
jgi:hypothetical protein